ncbi:MAG: PIN domain-containing protein [Methanothrix sp.]
MVFKKRMLGEGYNLNHLSEDMQSSLSRFLDHPSRSKLRGIHLKINYYKEYIISKRAKHLQTGSFEHALQFILGSINIVPSEMYFSRIKEAFQLMKDRDPKDTLFLALALQLGSPLWSNDKHFQDLPEVTAYSTGALIEHMRARGIWW